MSFSVSIQHGLQGVSSMKWRSNFSPSNDDTQWLNTIKGPKIYTKHTKVARNNLNIWITSKIYTNSL